MKFIKNMCKIRCKILENQVISHLISLTPKLRIAASNGKRTFACMSATWAMVTCCFTGDLNLSLAQSPLKFIWITLIFSGTSYRTLNFERHEESVTKYPVTYTTTSNIVQKFQNLQ
jgi:hypothetical protein